MLNPGLAGIHGWDEQQIDTYIEAIREIALVVSGSGTVEIPALTDRDPSDVPFVVAALEGQADVIVSQDADLLDLQDSEALEVEILDPLAFLRRLRALTRL